MEMEHSQGPWQTSGVSGTAVYSSTGEMVAAVYGDDPACRVDERMQANKHLIAAAPELLAALKEVVAFWDAITMEDCVNELHVKARAVIAKATGSKS